MTIITKHDLAEVPNLPSSEADLTYAARRASSAVGAAWANPVDPAPLWVKDIAIDVAVRYLHNPRGTTSVTRSIDDASRTERYERGSIPGGNFSLTDAEADKLTRRPRRRTGSIRLTVPGYQP